MALQTERLYRQLYRWYETHGRAGLPWRNTDDPYHIYLSEVMLQQTQVKTVLERFYFPFLEQFPTLQALADAEEEEVLKAWEGLGYYSRARNLHKAAKACAPQLPESFDALLALPGIGRNTASAICAFAYHQPYPVMEANLKRVLCRFWGMKHPSDKELWEKADALLDKEHVFDYNQAMMDIGAMICTMRSPACGECPLQHGCRGKENPSAYGVKKAVKNVPIRSYHTIVFEKQGEWLLLKRETNFLHGMYSFCEMAEPELHLLFEVPPETLGMVSQTYSHFIANAEVYHYSLEDGSDQEVQRRLEAYLAGKEHQWVTKSHLCEQTASLPLSGIDHKVMRLVFGSI